MYLIGQAFHHRPLIEGLTAMPTYTVEELQQNLRWLFDDAGGYFIAPTLVERTLAAIGE